MSHTPQELLTLAIQFEELSKTAKDKKKLDPKAKVRNRGTVCVPASSAKDKKDHFPINSEAQARNALARVHQYDKTPSWYSGSLKSLQELVSRKVHSKYKGIGKGDKKKKSSLENIEDLLIKCGISSFPPELEYYTLDEVAETLPVSTQTYGALWALMPSDEQNPPYQGETPPEPDHSSRKARSLKKFWHKLSPEQQEDIAGAKARDEAEMKKYRPKRLEDMPGGTYPYTGNDEKKESSLKFINSLLQRYAQQTDDPTGLVGQVPGNFRAPVQNAPVWNPTQQSGADAKKFMQGNQFTAIPKDVQNSLNTLLGLKLIPDGKLGPQTRAALDNFKAKYNMASGATDQDVFNLVRSTATRNMSQSGGADASAKINNLISYSQKLINKAYQDMSAGQRSGKGMDTTALGSYVQAIQTLYPQMQALQSLSLNEDQKANVSAILGNLQMIGKQLEAATSLNVGSVPTPAPQPEPLPAQSKERPPGTTARRLDFFLNKYGN